MADTASDFLVERLHDRGIRRIYGFPGDGINGEVPGDQWQKEGDGGMAQDAATPWHVEASRYPATGPDIDKYRFLLRYAILAPSSHNTQPWLFRVYDDHLEVIADRSRALPVVDPIDRELVISCGGAIGMIRASLLRFGYSGDIELLPDSADKDLLARVKLGSPHEPTLADQARFAAISRRRSTRRKFEDEPLPPGLAEELGELAQLDELELAVITGSEAKSDVAELVAEADREQHKDPDFRKELSEWLSSRRTSSRDGMSLASFGAPDILSSVGGFIIRTLDVGRRVAANDKRLASNSPALVVIATRDDSPRDWLAAGMMHVTALLAVTARGLTAAYLNQPIELAKFRARLKGLAGVSGVPQLLFRIGRGPEVKPSVRRDLEEVLVRPPRARVKSYAQS
ncbi:Acg family FMN-binding oxidoreductase [Thiococcus pfennigii]|uniref:Acg family FMN-binding oxidoreductase n=1 Tax=Thiococcus pfennigii TaxID=1057 RepID=UPI0019050B75|nr:nitroreductase family protein [Thiococcus pfennigii]MBK1732404.1 hypothetical protein [Thiococcus pfennigii]